MTTKSRESIYGASVRAAAERAAEARKTADRLACSAWINGCSPFRDWLSLLRRWATLNAGYLDPSNRRARHRAATEGAVGLRWGRAGHETRIINPLGLGTVASYCTSHQEKAPAEAGAFRSQVSGAISTWKRSSC
jgi:hypothetical protein